MPNFGVDQNPQDFNLLHRVNDVISSSQVLTPNLVCTELG